MLGKPYIIFGIGIISLFLGVVIAISNSTNTMIEEQTEIADARYRGMISEKEYQAKSQESEAEYRSSVAESLEKIESKLIEAVKIVKGITSLADRGGNEELEVRLVEQNVNITSVDGRHVVVLNGTPYDLEDLFIGVDENESVVVKVVVIEQNNYIQTYPYLRDSDMAEILNVSEDGNITGQLDAIAGNLSQGIENFKTDSLT